ncbi:helix-turn-helix transcriptional regulator [Saccharibacillus sp. CPCC 101409]|uniref:helix-turn-helix domain-containing protein n=1 Tax=Saccharibacillus sp. CPCC 101409 TaxID=3058041 RepID=UPI002672FEC5|nr:helix-turn-helix transcriptional regulator [Saccharibacillus sp. CPCC 101409]MDO3409711.1 helix-turn-helix transcriptional regulator [Saccharibacillus sp. CPCC 101409]
MVHKAKSDQESAELFVKLLGEKVRELRVEKGLSQEKLGELAELNSNYIGQIERGEKSISVFTLKKIANGLSLSLEEVYRRIDPASHTDALEEVVALMLTRPEREHKKILALLKAAFEWKEDSN